MQNNAQTTAPPCRGAAPKGLRGFTSTDSYAKSIFSRCKTFQSLRDSSSARRSNSFLHILPGHFLLVLNRTSFFCFPGNAPPSSRPRNMHIRRPDNILPSRKEKITDVRKETIDDTGVYRIIQLKKIFLLRDSTFSRKRHPIRHNCMQTRPAQSRQPEQLIHLFSVSGTDAMNQSESKCPASTPEILRIPYPSGPNRPSHSRQYPKTSIPAHGILPTFRDCMDG